MSKIPEKILQAGCTAYADTFLHGSGSLGDGIEAAYLAIQQHDDWVRAGPPAWTGEGLPPVGTVCEHSVDDNKADSPDGAWKRVKIVGHHQFNDDEYLCAVWVSGLEVSYSSEGPHFRPIRTPEQIAEEARLAELNLMIGAIKDHPGGRHGIDHLTQLKIHEEACINLYDAGWRKQVVE